MTIGWKILEFSFSTASFAEDGYHTDHMRRHLLRANDGVTLSFFSFERIYCIVPTLCLLVNTKYRYYQNRPNFKVPFFVYVPLSNPVVSLNSVGESDVHVSFYNAVIKLI